MFDFRTRQEVIAVKQPWELAVMREAGRRLAEVSVVMRDAIVPGISTLDLDRLAADKIKALGGTPSFLGYVVDKTPFPATICASVNDQVVHGIPNAKPLSEGDIVSIDLGLHYGGYHADMAFTAPIGRISEDARRLLDATRASLYIGIAQAQPGGRIGDIGHAIEASIRPHKLGIVRQYVGHGIGRAMHERPSVPNYGKANTGELIKVGTCLAIEPMITLGTWKTKTLKDDWTVVTADGTLAAHYEHTIAITPEGPEILTVLDGVSPV